MCKPQLGGTWKLSQRGWLLLNAPRRLSWLRSERWAQLIGVVTVPRHSPFVSFLVFANLKVFVGDGTGPSGTDVD